MIPIETLTTFLIASTLLCIAPGPDNLFVLTQSMVQGRKSGVMITLGLCTGLLFHTTAVALGLAVLFQTSAVAFTILKGLGAAYLLYLAWQAFRASSIDTSHPPASTSGSALYRRGIIMNITNPKVSIFFLAFLPQFTAPAAGSVTAQLFLLGGLFIVVALLFFITLALLAGGIGEWFSRSPQAQPILNRIAGTVFAGLALKLALSNNE